MLTIVITAYGEPKSTEKAVNKILGQDIPQDYRVVVADPFVEVKWFIEERFGSNPKVEFFLDPDKGKSYALNLIIQKYYSENKDDMFIFTDGDVYVSDTAIKDIVPGFFDPLIGIVTGHPVSLDSRSTMFGYWSHLLFHEMNLTRKKASNKKDFFEASGYLFAIRQGVIKEFPVDASEDNVIAILFWNKGYKCAYSESAKVYVLNPKNVKDWMLQKKRNIKGHIALGAMGLHAEIRKNTFFSEAFRGLRILSSFPNNVKEFFWTLILMFTRLYAWFAAYYEVKVKKQPYSDGWRGEGKIETTRPMDA